VTTDSGGHISMRLMLFLYTNNNNIINYNNNMMDMSGRCMISDYSVCSVISTISFDYYLFNKNSCMSSHTL
jgi:hypothetical protein